MFVLDPQFGNNEKEAAAQACKKCGYIGFLLKQRVTFLLCQNTLLLVYLGLCRITPKSQCIVFVQQQGILQNEEKSGFNRRLGRH